MKHTKPYVDPYQSVHKYNRSTENATLTLLHNAYTHLEKTGLFVWILFIGFSSAFNTIQPYLLTSKLLKLDFNPRLILWIVNFLVNHSQTVYHQAALLSSCSISIGSPHGTVLSPILLYTGTDTTPIIKYWQFCNRNPSNSDSVYFAEVEKFSNWFRDNSLDLNVKKTKEMLTDFRKAPTVISYLFIDGMKVERVNTNI